MTVTEPATQHGTARSVEVKTEASLSLNTMDSAETKPVLSPALTYLVNRIMALEVERDALASRFMVESAAIRRNKIAALRDAMEAIALLEGGAA